MPLSFFKRRKEQDHPKQNTIRVSRAVIVDTTKDINDQLKTETQNLNLSELVGKETKIGDVESDQINNIVWANSKGIYAVYVALSRFLSKFCLDKEFREEVLKYPSRYQIYLYHMNVSPENLFVFDEEGDRKVHNYPYITGATVHFLVQKADIILPIYRDFGPTIISPATILEEFQRILFSQEPDLTLRIAENLLRYAGKNEELGGLEAALLKSQSPYETSPTCFSLINDFFTRSGLNRSIAEDIIARAISMHFVRLEMYPEFIHKPEIYNELWNKSAEGMRLDEMTNDPNSNEMKLH